MHTQCVSVILCEALYSIYDYNQKDFWKKFYQPSNLEVGPLRCPLIAGNTLPLKLVVELVL